MDSGTLQIVQIDATAVTGLLILLSFSFLGDSNDTIDLFSDHGLSFNMLTAFTITPFAFSALFALSQTTEGTVKIRRLEEKSIGAMVIGFAMILAVIITIFAITVINYPSEQTKEYGNPEKEVTFSYPKNWKISVTDDMINITNPSQPSANDPVSIWSEKIKNTSEITNILRGLLPNNISLGEPSNLTNKFGKNAFEVSYILHDVKYHHIIAETGSRLFVISYFDPKRGSLIQQTGVLPTPTDPKIRSIIRSINLGLIEVTSVKPNLSVTLETTSNPVGEVNKITILVKDSFNNSSIKDANITGWLFYPGDKRILLEPTLTNDDGIASFRWKSTDHGYYRLKLTVERNDYEPVELSKTFSIS